MTGSNQTTIINSRNPLALIGTTCDVAGNVITKSGEVINLFMDILVDVAKGGKVISGGELNKLEIAYDPELMQLVENHQSKQLMMPLSE
ncbi:MAG TPA: hypothetical protein P5280_10360 [Cyclobacteriaceae bacterium]|nr:hypothetical protein [Cyclobacteriaceae bacterium]